MELGKAEEFAEELRQKILNGTIQTGTKLAPERDLANEFKISRATVRKALEILEGEGLVARYPVRGTFVGGIRERILVDRGREIQDEPASTSIEASELKLSGSFLKDMERIGRKPQIQLLEQPSLVAANAEIAKHLQIEEGTLVLKRYRLQSADNLAYRVIESYYPSDLFGELLTTDIGDTPLFVWLQERHSLTAAHAQETLIARLATQNERQLLRISPTSPVVALDRTVWADTCRPIEWAHITAVAGLYVFNYEYDISEWNKKKEGKRGSKRDQPNTQ